MTPSEPSELPVYCIHLRSKTMYQSDTTDPRGDEFETDPQCWCQRTMGQVGPDDDFVALDLCKPGRVCFEGLE